MFLSKVHARLRGQLYEGDEKALWLFGYWLGIMCRYEGTWWCAGRMRRDYERVLGWLRELKLGERDGVEGESWREMMGELEMAHVWKS
jgi:hypothetical protein